MASRKEYEMLFRLNAEMDQAFSGNFSKAQSSIAGIEKEIVSLQKTQADISSYTKQQQSVEATTNKLSVLQKQYDNIQKEIDETGKFSSDLQNKLLQKQMQIDKTKASLDKETDSLHNMENALQSAGVDTSKLADESKRLEDEIDGLKDAQEDAADGSDSFGDKAIAAFTAVKNTLVALGIVKLIKEIADGLIDCANASMEFETAMASVQRTVGVSGDALTNLGDAFKELSLEMPITTTELGNIATTAGQLGIASDKIEEFTRIMAELATTTDLTADDAATYLAQFTNITGTTDYERLGAAVASLGDATATTASKVVQMSQGMAASASLAGMSETDILAISAAVGSLGIEAQAGSTAMSTLISTLYKATETEDGLEDYANVAGMTAEEFKKSWGEDAVGTMNAFIQGLTDTERNGKSAIVILDDLGITNVRQTKAILGLASAGDLLSNTIEQANTAWEENTALQEKAGIMYDTTESQLTMMKNSWNNLKVAVGDYFTPALKDTYEWLNETFQSLTKWVEEIDNGVPSVHELTEETRELQKTLTSGEKTMNSSMEQTEQTATAVEYYCQQLDELIDYGLESEDSQRKYNAICELLIDNIPDLADLINDESIKVEDLTTKIRENTAAWEENQKQQAMETYYSEAYQAMLGAGVEKTLQEGQLDKAELELERLQKDLEAATAARVEYFNYVKENKGRHTNSDTLIYLRNDSEWARLNEEEEALKEQVSNQTKTIENYQTSIAEAEKTYQEAQQAVEDMKEAIDKFSEELNAEMEKIPSLTSSNTSTEEPYATGTLNATAGIHLVGENGPELVGFGGGERVLNAASTSRLLGGVTLSVNFNIEGSVGAGAAEALSEFGNDFASKVLDVLEEAGIDSRRRAYA